MMTQAYYTGISGLKSSSYGIDIVSDNLANVNSAGYRGNDYEFASLFEDTVATTSNIPSNSVGIGTRVQATPMTQEQGSLLLSERSTDLAISGEGWFGVEDNGKQVFTRKGAFLFDKERDLVTEDGNYVLGTIGGNISGEILTQPLAEVPLGDVSSQEKLRFPKTLTYPSQSTTKAQFFGNIGTTPELRTMSAEVIDPDGIRNELKLEFSMVEPQISPGTQWNVTATTQDRNDNTIIYDSQQGVVTFDATGALLSATLPQIDNNGTPVTIDLGSGYSGVTAVANSDISASSSSDGMISGDLVGYDINENGEVLATFTNGIQSSVGKIAVYHFQNDQALDRLSGTNFQASSNSGKPIFYKDSSGKNILGSDISNFKLESSNVDMTVGLTDLIILQRTYDANSKTITTADEMIQKALNMDA